MTQPCPTFPFDITIDKANLPASLFNGSDVIISVESGLMTLLGPNGAGKTKVMKALRDKLRAEYGQGFVRFVSAGRMGVLEVYRSDQDGAGATDSNQAHVGNYNHVGSRKQSESVTGDFITLQSRADIRLKVEARLQGLFNKSIKLNWTQSGLKVDFKSLDAGSEAYGAGNEASGLTQLAAILAAIYDDEIIFLLLDEPEVSLHPQLQAFILKEIQSVIGDPNRPGKKCVIISTHSPAMLQLKSVSDLPSIVFFRKSPDLPVQISSSSSILDNPNLKNLLLRLSETYKTAFFANSVLLSEGVSDEIVINTLADINNENFAAMGVQVVAVNGKTALPVADQLFTAIGKKVCMLGDLDVLDDPALVKYLDREKGTATHMSANGYASLEALLTEIDSELSALVSSNITDITISPAFTPSTATTALLLKRQVLVFLANAESAVMIALNNSSLWTALKQKLILLLDQLDHFNLILIRKGDIEECYLCPTLTGSKPTKAYDEANYLIANNPAAINTSYQDILKAIKKFNQKPPVDEEALLRSKLGKILGAIDANFSNDITDAQITTLIENEDEGFFQIFEIKTATDALGQYLEVKTKSTLFKGYNSTIIHRKGESTHSLLTKLPST